MAPPTKQIQPKSRAQLWRETVMGGALFVFGLVVIWQYLGHSEHGHNVDSVLLWVGVGCVATGLFMTNKKLVKEWLNEIGKLLRFWKGGSDG